MNYGPLAPYYIALCAGPVWLGAVAVHVLAAHLMGCRAAAAVGVAFLAVCLPVLVASMRDVHGHVFQGRCMLYLSLGTLHAFHALACRAEAYLTLLLAAVAFLVPLAVVEIAHDGREWVVAGVFTWQAACALALALRSLWVCRGVAFRVHVA
eukprot:3027281-Rhodomonas_salina.1